MKNQFDLDSSPWTVIWETTQASDIACREYDWVQPEVDPLELSTQEAEQLLREVAELQPHVFMLTGADPLKREDIYHLVRYACLLGMRPIMALRATPLLTKEAIARLKEAGVSRIMFTLDGSTAYLHDLLCGVHGSFERTLEATQWADDCRLPFQITTHLGERNLHDLENMVAVLRPFRILQWNVAFPVPGEMSQIEELPSAREFEDVFARLYKLAQEVSFKIRTTEAPHYRRYILQKQAEERANGPVEPAHFEQGIPGILPVNEDRGMVFVSHTGEVYPCESLPIVAGNVRVQKLTDIYRSAQILKDLRDANQLTGKCGLCAFKGVCGGSRARSFAMNSDSFDEDPACIYRPLQAQGVRKTSRGFLPPEQAVVERDS